MRRTERRAAPLLLFLALVPAVSAAQGPRLEIEPEEWDFGAVGPGESLVHDFALKNAGRRSLEIGRIASACSCIATVIGDATVPAGGATTLRVTLETGALRGVVERWITIRSNDSRGPRRLMVRAYVEAAD